MELDVPRTPRLSLSTSTTADQNSSNLTFFDIEARKDKDVDHSDYPEGGWTAWLTVLGSFLMYFASFGVTNSFGVFQVGR